MDILNFISWIKGKRQVTSVDASKTLLPVGIKDPKRDDDYIAGAITVEDFINQVGTGSVGPQGPMGPQGVPGPVGPAGLVWQGLWSASGVYAENDSVSFGGASYFCYNPAGIGPSVSNPTIDTANWALLAAEGATGPQGPQGIQGPTGQGSPNFVSTGTFTTNSLTDSVLTSILIPANTYSTNDAFSVVAQFTKTADSYTPSYSLHINTSNTLAGASQLATSNMGALNRYGTIFRNFFINGTNTSSLSVSQNNASDITNSTNPVGIMSIDWTQNQYLIVAGRTSDGLYALTCRGIRIY